MAKSKSNKGVLQSVNYSLDIINKIKAHEDFTNNEKSDILNKFVGMSTDNNSYFTPDIITKFIVDIIGIKSGKVADLSAGIGNFIKPFISEYGKLEDGIEFDCFEKDENNYLAGATAWSDYKQVNFHSTESTLNEGIDNKYDFILGNPPFSGSVEYKADWNIDSKGKVKKKLDIVSAFIDKCFKAVKDNGYVGLVLPGGYISKGATELCRKWLNDTADLKLYMELSSETFSNSGILGTSVGTVVCIWQKNKTKNNIPIICIPNDKDDLSLQFKGFIKNYNELQKKHSFAFSRNLNTVYATIDHKPTDEFEIESDNADDSPLVGKCYCCDKDIHDNDDYAEYETIKDNKPVMVCLECDNDEYIYQTKMIPNLLFDGEKLTPASSSHIKEIEKRYYNEMAVEKEFDRAFDLAERQSKYYVLMYQANLNKDKVDYHAQKFVSSGINCPEDDFIIVKCDFPFYIEPKKFENVTLDRIVSELEYKRESKSDNKRWFDYYTREIENVKANHHDYCTIYFDSFNIEHEKVKAPEEKDWRDRQRFIIRGHIITECDLYDTTFACFMYSDHDYFSVCVNYDYICSRSYIYEKLIENNYKDILKSLIKG